MMSFLKSILRKSKKEVSSQKMLDLLEDLAVMQDRLDSLEKDVKSLTTSMEEMAACVQNVTLVMHSLSQEVLTIVSAINSFAAPREADMFSLGFNNDDDDDNLLN